MLIVVKITFLGETIMQKNGTQTLFILLKQLIYCKIVDEV